MDRQDFTRLLQNREARAEELRQKAEMEMTDSNTREYIEPAKPLRYRVVAQLK
jgi:hypothetical protein